MTTAEPTILIRTARPWAPDLHFAGLGIVVDSDDPAVRRSWSERGFSTCWYPLEDGSRPEDLPGSYLAAARQISRERAMGSTTAVLAGPDWSRGLEQWRSRFLATMLVPGVVRFEMARYPERLPGGSRGTRALSDLLILAYALRGLPRARPLRRTPASSGIDQVLLVAGGGPPGGLEAAGRLLLEHGVRPSYAWRKADLPGRDQPSLALVDLSEQPPAVPVAELEDWVRAGGHMIAFGAREGKLGHLDEADAPDRLVLVEWPLRVEAPRENLIRALGQTALQRPLARPDGVSTRRGSLTGVWRPPGSAARRSSGLLADLLSRRFTPSQDPMLEPGREALLCDLEGADRPESPVVTAGCLVESQELDGDGWRLTACGPEGMRTRIRLRTPQNPRLVEALPDEGRSFFYIWEAATRLLTLTFRSSPDPLEIRIQI